MLPLSDLRENTGILPHPSLEGRDTWFVVTVQKEECWCRLLELLGKVMQREDCKVLIFVETKRKADEITRSMRRDGWPALCIHGDKQQGERDWVLAGSLPFPAHSFSFFSSHVPLEQTSSFCRIQSRQDTDSDRDRRCRPWPWLVAVVSLC